MCERERPSSGAARRAWYERSRWTFAAVCLLFAAPIPLIPVFRSRTYLVLDGQAYLVFHNVAELFAVAWFTHEQTNDKHNLFLGCVFLAVGLVDLMHTLGYAGMLALAASPGHVRATWSLHSGPCRL